MSTVHRTRRPRSRFRRSAALTRARLRRRARRIARRLILLGGWTWLAAGSLVGFEVLEMLFGTLALAPEFIPLLVVALAVAWYFRDRLRRAARRLRLLLLWLRIARRRRSGHEGRSRSAQVQPAPRAHGAPDPRIDA